MRRWLPRVLMAGIGWYGILNPIDDGWEAKVGVTVCALWVAMVCYVAGYEDGRGATGGEG